MKKTFTSKKGNIFPLKIDELDKILKARFETNPDLSFTTYEKNNKKIAVFFIAYQVESEKIDNFLLEPILMKNIEWTNHSILNEIPLNGGKKVETLEDILKDILIGAVFIYIEGEDSIIAYLLSKKEKRSLQQSETESLVLGPKIGFTESMVTNLNIVRWTIRSEDLVLEQYLIGKREPREVRLIYMKSIANEVDVNTMRQRLQELEIDVIDDASVLMQYIEDSSITIFPQFLTTELPDRFSYNINRGRLGILVENSPTAIITPTTFFSFFESTEDLYMRWNIGTFLRGLRYLSFFMSTFLTPLYVAAVTFHYEIIPTPLLINLGESRSSVPFPPILEALFLELMIELLRESGARLPTKVGQTIGIVGGVVVGTAAVEAGITSNVLIIFVALSALASFTTPNYLMGTTARIIRFPMILLGGFLGLIGIMFGACFLIIHLLRLTSLGRPYLSPLYPLVPKDFNKVLFRLPNEYQNERFRSYRPKDLIRFGKKKAKNKKDIDE
ncbi:spore germination protein [Oceanobacillus bengalensis]|uniref:Spore germination protein n=1 Tax=Oceanobacillus bengalensis TaxID=1435466 RepID=A0A494Z822_9BACI|nr:spore germination protein [Oceanobacillus bengalensis]RKQ18761.1 spore germination protein [Oceanobacillus bengalensis]